MAVSPSNEPASSLFCADGEQNSMPVFKQPLNSGASLSVVVPALPISNLPSQATYNIALITAHDTRIVGIVHLNAYATTHNTTSGASVCLCE